MLVLTCTYIKPTSPDHTRHYTALLQYFNFTFLLEIISTNDKLWIIECKFGRINEIYWFYIDEVKKSEANELKKVLFQWTEAEPGAKVVLNFWPISRLAVLIKVVLIKKACIIPSSSLFQSILTKFILATFSFRIFQTRSQTENTHFICVKVVYTLVSKDWENLFLLISLLHLL